MAISSISNDTSPAFLITLIQQLILGEIIVLLAVSFSTVRDENEPNLWQDGNQRGASVRALIKPLAAAVALAISTSTAHAQHASAGGPPAIPVYPPYPYKAGHYPTAEAYYDLPPYAATNPSFYRWRFFMIGQERNRYRYMPHIFRGYSGYPEDTVSSSAMTPEPVSKPMTPNSPPKAEPSPAAPAGVSEPNAKRKTQGLRVNPDLQVRPAPKRREDRQDRASEVARNQCRGGPQAPNAYY